MDYWAPKIAKMFRTAFLLLSSWFIINCSEKASDTMALPYYNAPDFTPVFIQNEAEVKEKIPHTIRDFSFINQDSALISQATIEGKIHVANFIFTSCISICPVMTKNMKLVSDSLKNDGSVAFLSYSVTPWIDTPSVLTAFKVKNNIRNPHWHFLTGNRSTIYALARQSYFAEEDIGFSKDSSEFLHTEHFILVDKTKRIRGVYNGTLSLEMQQLIEDIKTLKAE
ncbi:SCO family protein [Runella slithyformis]|uniref:Electron transport protein SCO1/SenC n=1 Tax=Runella slithyformis (strain ATCC 29530 / DSM 19594 / LMG 11500 / NCIMB 11436 / LSU 4) TaxID=761193 RepID=A0A7U4E7U5_RUNSL|nr:electron transport protein SCO1/SenC [Runella slithyformis DSM 19594]